MASYPVNQQIVVDDPLISQNCFSRTIELGNVEGKGHRFTGAESYMKICYGGNELSRGPVEESERNRRDRTCGDFVFFGERGI